VYINVARKIYTNVYLFEKINNPLQIQKHNRELELIIRECILNTVRESVPVENILRAYMDETTEQHVEVKEIEEQIPIPDPEPQSQSQPEPVKENISNINPTPVSSTPVIPSIETEETNSSQIGGNELNIDTSGSLNITKSISFNDIDKAVDVMGNEVEQHVPKTIENLEQISITKRNNEQDDSEDEDRLDIGDDVSLDFSDINDLNRPMVLEAPPILDDIEVLG
jgi:hypothetical protein